MKKEGAIILGTGGDNSNSAQGTFYEGVMTTGYPSDATENSVQADIVSAKYATSGSGGTTSGGGTSSSCSALYGQCGGTGYTGATCCSSGTCTYSNPYYSQCV
jgi:non-reducing end alpha-L-arabinofuranosidase